MDKYFNKDWHPIKIFFILFFLNTVSLFLNLLSGFIIFLPFIVAIIMGINIGIIIYHSLDGRFYYISLINPVAANPSHRALNSG